jgi:hypothetical protein
MLIALLDFEANGADDDLQLLLLELTVRMVASANPRWP